MWEAIKAHATKGLTGSLTGILLARGMAPDTVQHIVTDEGLRWVAFFLAVVGFATSLFFPAAKGGADVLPPPQQKGNAELGLLLLLGLLGLIILAATVPGATAAPPPPPSRIAPQRHCPPPPAGDPWAGLRWVRV